MYLIGRYRRKALMAYMATSSSTIEADAGTELK